MAIFNSGYKYASIMEFIKLINLGVIFYIVVNFVKKGEDIKKLLNIILIIGTGIALFGILQYIGVIGNSWWDNPKFLSATYVNHNHFAGLMGLVIPLSIGMILSEKDMGKRPLYIYAFLVLSSAFLLSMSRGGWFSLSVALLFMTFFILRKGKSRFIFFMSILLLITIGIFVFNATDMNLLLNRMSSYGELDFSGRCEIWKGTLDLIKDNWLFGVGPGAFIYNFPKYRPAGLNMFVNYAHSDYLQVFSEMGIFALGLMVFIITRIIRKGLATFKIARTPFKSWISLSLAVGVLTISLHGLGDFNFYIPANAIIFTVFCGLIFNVSSKKEKKYPQLMLKVNPALGTFFKSLTLITIITLIIFISTALLAEICSTASDRALIRNNMEKAEHLSLVAITMCPFNHSYPYKLANIYDKKAQGEADGRQYINKSVERYKEALHLNPIDAWSWIGLADSYYQLSRYPAIDYNFFELADSAYRKAIDLDPVNWYYLKKHAGFLLNSGNAALSSQMYKRVSHAMSESKERSLIASTFTDGESYEEMADLAFAAQDISKALVYYEMAEVIRENNENAKLGQLRCYLKMSLVKDALLKYRKLRSSVRSKSILFTSLGECYLNMGYIETAGRFLEKSLTVNPENAEAYQLKHKISKKTGKGNYPVGEIYKILDFNSIPVSVDFGADGFNMTFDIKKDMCCGGEFALDIFLPAGMYEFNINARGQEALGTWPHMIVKFNNKHTMDVYLNDNWMEYSGIIIVDCSINRFGIVFDNDYYDEESMEDRNLYIDGIRLKAL